jgi:hypothetical protein
MFNQQSIILREKKTRQAQAQLQVCVRGHRVPNPRNRASVVPAIIHRTRLPSIVLARLCSRHALVCRLTT